MGRPLQGEDGAYPTQLPPIRYIDLVDLLCQLDDHPLWPTDVAQHIAVFKLLYLTERIRAVLCQPGNNSFDIVDNECNMPDTQGIGGRLLNSPVIRGPMAVTVSHQTLGSCCPRVANENVTWLNATKSCITQG